MDKIQKALKKFSVKEKRLVDETVEKLMALHWTGLNIVKLKGNLNLFRVRKGNLRIIFRVQDKEVEILAIDRRSEKTYRDF